MIDKSTLRYIVVGVVGSLLFLVLLMMQVEILLLDPVISAVISNLIVIIGTYVASYKWVFRSNKPHQYAFIRYIIVIGIGFVINTVGMYLSVHVFEFWYLTSQIILFSIVAVNNYSFNKLWAFKNS